MPRSFFPSDLMTPPSPLRSFGWLALFGKLILFCKLLPCIFASFEGSRKDFKGRKNREKHGGCIVLPVKNRKVLSYRSSLEISRSVFHAGEYFTVEVEEIWYSQSGWIFFLFFFFFVTTAVLRARRDIPSSNRFHSSVLDFNACRRNAVRRGKSLRRSSAIQFS